MKKSKQKRASKNRALVVLFASTKYGKISRYDLIKIKSGFCKHTHRNIKQMK
jgi:hypothetical protein